eukprot:364044-Chlamydomonas_euryale.AAC.1
MLPGAATNPHLHGQVSYETGMPVRVVRGAKVDGALRYTFDGLYRVVEHKTEPSEDGPLVIKVAEDVCGEGGRPAQTVRHQVPHAGGQLCGGERGGKGGLASTARWASSPTRRRAGGGGIPVRTRQDVPGLARMCQDSPGCRLGLARMPVRTRQDVPGLARMCQDSPGCRLGLARMCQVSPGCARTRQDVPGLARMSVRTRQDVPGLARMPVRTCQDVG